jgi:hypothetical protein
MEEAPGDCHRHHAICGPHFPEAIHIFRDEQFTVGALQAALNAGDATRLYGEAGRPVPVMRPPDRGVTTLCPRCSGAGNLKGQHYGACATARARNYGRRVTNWRV